MASITRRESCIGTTFWCDGDEQPVSADESRGIVLDAVAEAVLRFAFEEGRAPLLLELAEFMLLLSEKPFTGTSPYGILMTAAMLKENSIGFTWTYDWDDRPPAVLGYLKLNSIGKDLVKDCYEHLHETTRESRGNHSSVQGKWLARIYFSWTYDDESERPDNKALLNVGFSEEDFDKRTPNEFLAYV